jgi:hypothetical protein
MQFENVYQVVRLDAFGDNQYRLTARPTRCQPTRCWSNPADNYPINTLSFWWADTRHPLLGARTRGAIAAALGAVAVLSLVWLGISLRPPGARSRRVSADIGFSPAESTG